MNDSKSADKATNLVDKLVQQRKELHKPVFLAMGQSVGELAECGNLSQGKVSTPCFTQHCHGQGLVVLITQLQGGQEVDHRQANIDVILGGAGQEERRNERIRFSHVEEAVLEKCKHRLCDHSSV